MLNYGYVITDQKTTNSVKYHHYAIVQLQKNVYLCRQNRLTNMNFVLPAWIDYWGYDSAHDWAWWRKQMVYFMDHLLTEETVEYVI